MFGVAGTGVSSVVPPTTLETFVVVDVGVVEFERVEITFCKEFELLLLLVVLVFVLPSSSGLPVLFKLVFTPSAPMTGPEGARGVSPVEGVPGTTGAEEL